MSTPEPRLPTSFGSLLSVAEFANAGRASLTPVCAVQGCQVAMVSYTADRTRRPSQAEYRKRAYGAPLPGSGADAAPMTNLTNAVNELRGQVLSEVREHAASQAAQMVVGLAPVATAFNAERVEADLHTRTQRRRHAQAYAQNTYTVQDTRVIELQMSGTAVRGPGVSPSPPAGPGRGLPALCTLSMSEVAKLALGGWQVVDIVASSAFWRATRVNAAWGARELTPLTQSWHSARSEAHAQLDAQVETLGADGVVGLSIETTEQAIEAAAEGAWPLRIVGVTAMGTAIRRINPDARPPAPETMLVLR